MKTEQFNSIIEAQTHRCLDILERKSIEYAGDTDKLHNFHNAAAIENCTPIQALGGMMAKHTVSIYDMIMSGKDYTSALWDEKITDHINYLLILKTLLVEDAERRIADECSHSENTK